MRVKPMKKWLLLPVVLILCLAGFYLLFPAATLELAVTAERTMAGLESHSIDVDGQHFEYLEGGEGEPLVLLHGFAAGKDHWTRVAAYLTPHFRVIIPDLPGFGESGPAADNDYRISRQSGRLQAFLAALQLDSFHLGGSSMGGYLAGLYAVQHPQSVRTLWLIAPSGMASAEPGELAQLLAAGKPNPLIVESVEDYERLLDFVFTERPFIPAPVKAVLVDEAVRYRELHDEIFTQLEQDDDTPPLEPLLMSAAVPLFVLWGRDDRVLNASSAEILSEIMPGAEIRVMTRTGHLPMIERPEQSAKYYLEFLRAGL
jgi:pimeloyl-ACP methyl ester carboxylesterase